ncbi:hypothetical protein Tco_0316063 [Tanacetum coccineum]
MNVSPIPTTRIHKNHPKDQIIRDINLATQMRRMTKISEELAMKVWRWVDLPKGKHAIGTKWVYRNKKDERGIVVRNKARLVAQGYTQEEGIDYDEVFDLPKGKRAIRTKWVYRNKKMRERIVIEVIRYKGLKTKQKRYALAQRINEELAEYINTPNWNLPTSSYDDDDDEEISIPLKDIIISGLPLCVAITPALSPEEPVDSLIMEDEHLDIISEMESDEFIKSSVENLVQNPSESEDVSDGNDDESSHKEEIHEMSFITYSNPLFDLDEEINSSEFNPIHNEDLDSTLKNDRFDTESYLLESLINRDTFMTFSPKIDFLIEEFADELALLKPSSLGINKADYDPKEEIRRVERLLYDNSSPRPPKELNVENSIESFPPSHIPVEDSDPFMEEIVLFLSSDESIPPGIDSDYSNSEGDNLFVERLLYDDPTPLLDIPSPTHVSFLFEEHHDLDFTCVVRVFLPFFTYSVTSSSLLSFGSEDTIFDPGIFTFHFSSLKPVAYENPIVIFLFFCFCPKDKGIRGEIPYDHEDLCLFSILQSSGLRSSAYYGNPQS